MRDIKTKCFKNPRKKLWTGATREITNVQTIFNHINSLDYGDLPDYNFITDNLVDIYNNYEMLVESASTQPHTATNVSTTTQLPLKTYIAKRKPANQVMDTRYLKMQLEIARESELQEYFKDSNIAP